MSAFGTKRTCPSCRSMSAFGGKADIECSDRVFLLLTQRPLPFVLSNKNHVPPTALMLGDPFDGSALSLLITCITTSMLSSTSMEPFKS